jgi:murein DD-endopeptidase MepM/ murein hydrolase activator NlpD
VTDGDSWFRIAQSVGVPVSALVAANSATSETVLHIGDLLCLPVSTRPSSSKPSAVCAGKHTVVAGDSWYGIASGAGVAPTALLALNDASASSVLVPGDELCLPAGATTRANTAPSCTATVTAAAGDSWYVISRSSGVPLPALYAANDATSSTVLNPGDRLCVPDVGFGASPRSLDAAPVRGRCRFANSWGAPRTGGRRHVGVDLVAPQGAPVVAVVAGTLTRQNRDRPGSLSGNAWWLSTVNGTSYFYAHLAGFRAGLEVGSAVRPGDVIGYVGSSGNARLPHLHFEIHPYGSGPINPYDAIWMVGGCALDRRYEQAAYS